MQAKPTRRTARGIVIHGGNILLMERWRVKDGHELHYFSIPGGGIDPGEAPEVAVVRELFEEMQVVVRPRQLLATLRDDKGAEHNYFVCDYLSGTPKLDPHSPEAKKYAAHHNRFKPQWVTRAEFEKLELNGIYEPIRPYIHKLFAAA